MLVDNGYDIPNNAILNLFLFERLHAMSSTKTCSYSVVLDEFDKKPYQCPRIVWLDGGEEECHCLFHSFNLDSKKDVFHDEILNAVSGNPSSLFIDGQRDIDDYYDFLGFNFPEDTSWFDYKLIKTIEHHLVFEKCIFSGGLAFYIITLEDQLQLLDSEVDGDLLLGGSVFQGNIFMINNNINGRIIFDNSKMEGHLIVDECTSEGPMTMNKFKVGSTATVRNINCGFWFKADNIEVGGDLNINNCSTDRISLKASNVKGDMILSRCKAEKDIDCSNSRVMNSYQVEDCEAATLNAKGLTYSGLLTISNLTLNGDIDNASDFTDVVLEKSSFIGTDLGTMAFSRVIIREVDFDRVTFGLQRRSMNRWWKKIFLSAWKVAPYRKDWSILSNISGRPKEMNFEETKARASSNKEDRIGQFETAEKVYRSLKHEMEKKHAGSLARRMRAGELECRFHGRYSMPDKFFIFLYRIVNGYGLKWFRALAILIAFIIVFSCFYYDQTATYEIYAVETSMREIRCINVGALEALWHSLEMTSIIVRPSISIENEAIRYAEGIERIICPIILLMFIQAFRNTVRD